MGTRIGFMFAKKQGKCFYCRELIAEGARCGFDNHIRRLVCAACGERKLDENPDQQPEGEQKPSVFQNVEHDWRPAIAALSKEIAELRKRVLDAISEESTS